MLPSLQGMVGTLPTQDPQPLLCSQVLRQCSRASFRGLPLGAGCQPTNCCPVLSPSSSTPPAVPLSAPLGQALSQALERMDMGAEQEYAWDIFRSLMVSWGALFPRSLPLPQRPLGLWARRLAGWLKQQVSPSPPLYSPQQERPRYTFRASDLARGAVTAERRALLVDWLVQVHVGPSNAPGAGPVAAREALSGEGTWGQTVGREGSGEALEASPQRGCFR